MPVLRELLAAAVHKNASDIHLKAGHRPYFRTYADLAPAEDAVWTAQDIMETTEAILPEFLRHAYHTHSEADFSHVEPGVGRFRINAFRSGQSPNLVIRLVPDVIPTIEDLHLPPFLKTLAHEPRGIILACGTTGAGKSTSLAAILEEINRNSRRRIITIEDPIEFIHMDLQSLVSQREVGADTDSYSAALRHILRQDPDVILIGEMRDAESFRAALAAAETGHLVFSTLHTGSASQAIPRILDMFPSSEHNAIRSSLAENIRSVFCQRLIPSGRGGIRPAVEILVNTLTVSKIILANQLEKLSAAIETGGDNGMQTFNQAIYQMIRNAEITEADGMRYASNPEALRMNLKGIFLDESRRILS
jgi:pilus retraction protein PilT